jgi:antitoxin VapB
MNAQSKIGRVASLFRSNRNQAVRIPKDMEFPEDLKKVVVRKVGKSIILTPVDALWDDFFNRPSNPDFPDRDQPAAQNRDWSFDD